jgi:hypothetical protein
MKKYLICFIAMICLIYALPNVVNSENVKLTMVEGCRFIFEAADTTKTCTFPYDFPDCELHSIKIIMPAFAATAPTATISILDPTGSTIYSQAGIAESTTTYIPLSRPLTFGSSYVILLTTTAGTGGGTATVDSWVYK